MEEGKPVTSPGTREEQATCHEQESEPMSLDDASKYRMIVARLNYLAADRPDIQFATKEASKYMSKPSNHH